MSKSKFWLIAVGLLSSSVSYASISEYYPYKITPSASNYGNTGILETPNARMMAEGQLRFNFSSSFPNEFTSMDWYNQFFFSKIISHQVQHQRREQMHIRQ